jgi:hypothetical protein
MPVDLNDFDETPPALLRRRRRLADGRQFHHLRTTAAA